MSSCGVCGIKCTTDWGSYPAASRCGRDAGCTARCSGDAAGRGAGRGADRRALLNPNRPVRLEFREAPDLRDPRAPSRRPPSVRSPTFRYTSRSAAGSCACPGPHRRASPRSHRSRRPDLPLEVADPIPATCCSVDPWTWHPPPVLIHHVSACFSNMLMTCDLSVQRVESQSLTRRVDSQGVLGHRPQVVETLWRRTATAPGVACPATVGLTPRCWSSEFNALNEGLGIVPRTATARRNSLLVWAVGLFSTEPQRLAQSVLLREQIVCPIVGSAAD